MFAAADPFSYRLMSDDTKRFLEQLFDGLYKRYSPKTKEDWMSLIGAFVTLAALFTQGISAGLLANDFYKEEAGNNTNPAAQITIGLIVFAAGLAGKYGFIHFCNDRGFRELANLDWKIFLNRKFWADNMPSHIIGFIGSTLFAGLSNINMDQTYHLAREYPGDFCKFLATFSHSPALKGLFFSANIWTNTMFFDFANKTFKSTFDLIKQTFRLGLDAEYRNHYIHYLNQLAAYNADKKDVITDFNTLIKKYREGDFNQDALVQEMSQKINAIEAIFDQANMNQYLSPMNQPITNIHKDIMARVSMLSLAAFCMVGYINFWKIGQDTMNTFCDAMNIPSSVSAVLRLIYATGAMIAMMAVALVATVGFQNNSVWKCRGYFEPALKTPEPNFLTDAELKRVNIYTVATCGIGSFPNGYQAWKIARESILLVMFALGASAVSETQGVYAMFLIYMINKITEKFPESQQNIVKDFSKRCDELDDKAGKVFKADFDKNIKQLEQDRRGANPGGNWASWCRKNTTVTAPVATTVMNPIVANSV